eukprot:TRINITY_DN8850_c0_g1_i1.p1 TRINITY_DN8850_c0_g1~~TRINITY_DN8850_c0_g1_i1.p1  ORF type:complete len:245 (-),score=70.20 TRINITY_DN8850_c0_g1_i1:1210-1917(-)
MAEPAPSLEPLAKENDQSTSPSLPVGEKTEEERLLERLAEIRKKKKIVESRIKEAELAKQAELEKERNIDHQLSQLSEKIVHLEKVQQLLESLNIIQRLEEQIQYLHLKLNEMSVPYTITINFLLQAAFKKVYILKMGLEDSFRTSGTHFSDKAKEVYLNKLKLIFTLVDELVKEEDLNLSPEAKRLLPKVTATVEKLEEVIKKILRENVEKEQEKGVKKMQKQKPVSKSHTLAK